MRIRRELAELNRMDRDVLEVIEALYTPADDGMCDCMLEWWLGQPVYIEGRLDGTRR